MSPFSTMTRRWLIAAALVCVLVALGIWAVRPTPFASWLNAGGIGNNGTPASIAAEWAGGQVAPMTPVGLMSTLPLADLGSFLALVSVLGIILLLVPTIWRDSVTGSMVTNARPEIRLPGLRVRLRTFLIGIAVLSLYLGWEVVEWRSWPLRLRYQQSAGTAAQIEVTCVETLGEIDRNLSAIEADTLRTQDSNLTPTARAAQKAYDRDTLRRQRAYWSNQADFQRSEGRNMKRPPSTLFSHSIPIQLFRLPNGASLMHSRRVITPGPSPNTMSRSGSTVNSFRIQTDRMDPGDLPGWRSPRRQAGGDHGRSCGRAHEVARPGSTVDSRRGVRRAWRFRQRDSMGRAGPRAVLGDGYQLNVGPQSTRTLQSRQTFSK